MPLDSQDEALFVLNTLDDAALFDGADGKPLTQSIDCLVVEGVDFDFGLIEDGVELCVGKDCDLFERQRRVGIVDTKVSEIEMECAAKVDIE